jgi:hypothetical protein
MFRSRPAPDRDPWLAFLNGRHLGSLETLHLCRKISFRLNNVRSSCRAGAQSHQAKRYTNGCNSRSQTPIHDRTSRHAPPVKTVYSRMKVSPVETDRSSPRMPVNSVGCPGSRMSWNEISPRQRDLQDKARTGPRLHTCDAASQSMGCFNFFNSECRVYASSPALCRIQDTRPQDYCQY